MVTLCFDLYHMDPPRDIDEWWLHSDPVFRSAVTSLHPPGRPCPYQRGCPTLQNLCLQKCLLNLSSTNTTSLHSELVFLILQWLPIFSNSKLRLTWVAKSLRSGPHPSSLLPCLLSVLSLLFSVSSPNILPVGMMSFSV